MDVLGHRKKGYLAHNCFDSKSMQRKASRTKMEIDNVWHALECDCSIVLPTLLWQRKFRASSRTGIAAAVVVRVKRSQDLLPSER